MRFIPTEIDGAYVIEPEFVRDDRGFFARIFDRDRFTELGLVCEFSQESVAYNDLAGTVRGLHYQIGVEEAKVVRVTSGAVLDFILDLRLGPGAPRWTAIELSAESRRALYVPPRCAHGYQTLVAGTEVSYLLSGKHDPSQDRGVSFDDPALGISLPLPVSRISQRDRKLPLYRDAERPWSFS